MKEKEYQYLFLPYTKPLDLLCTGFGYEHAKPGMVWGPASREMYVIHYVFSGKGTLHINRKDVPVTKGELFLIPPNVQAKYTASAEEPWHYCFVNFFISYNLFPEGEYVFRDEHFEDIFTSIFRMAQNERVHPFELNAELLRLFSVIAKNDDINLKQQQYVSSAISYIHEFYNRQLLVSDIANHLGLERSYLYSLFRKHVGISPKAYLTKHRLNVASSLLLSDAHIKNVALSCGYADVYSFSKAFKNQFGCSPSSYIKRKRTSQ